MPTTQHRATGVEYFEIYGLVSFRCAPLRATLQPKQCADRWAKAERGSSCHGCAIGAAHAGRPEAQPPPTRLPCCRCGRTDQRLLGKVLCVSDFNRQREVIREKNSKGDFPMLAGARLRWGFAIVRIHNSHAALTKMTERHRTAGSWSSGLRGQYLPGLPQVEALGEQHAWLAAVVTGREELGRIVARLLPEASIEDAEFSESFTEKHLRATNTNVRMGHSETPTRQGFPGAKHIISTKAADDLRVVTA